MAEKSLFSRLSLLFAGLSFFVIPVVFGIIGTISGIIGLLRQTRGTKKFCCNWYDNLYN